MKLLFSLFLLLPGCFYKSADLREKVVVRVNGHDLTSQQFGQNLARRLKDLDSISAKNPEIIEKNKSLVIESFITESLIADYAKEKGITVTTDETDAEVKKVRSSYPDDASFRTELALQNLSYDQWLKDLSNHLLQKKFFDYLGKQVSPPPADEIKSYYDTNKQRYASVEQILVRQIVTPNESQANRVKELLKKESFESLAKQYSIMPEKEKGGLVGWIDKDSVDIFAPFFNYQINRVMGPIESSYGYHIVRVEGKRKEAYRPFERVKEEIKRELANTRIQGYFVNWLSTQIKASKIFIDKEAIAAISVSTRKE